MRRRDFLAGGLTALFAAPFLTLRAHAGSGDGPKRLLIFHSPNGTVPHRLGVAQADALSFEAGSILEPLTGLEEHLLFLDNLDFSTGDNHEGGMAAMLTAGGADSLDQVVADHIGGESRFRSLELGALTGIWGGSTQTRASYRGGSFLTPDDDPVHAFRRIFGATGDDSLQARRQSVLDITREEVSSLRSRLGSTHRLHLDAHLAGFEALERSLQGGGSCDEPVAPEPLSPGSNDAFPDIVDAQIALAVQALACGATNVATVQCSHTVSPVVFTWLGHSEGHHALSHAHDGDTAGVQKFVETEQWFAERFADVVRSLAATPDPEGGTLLDTTLVLWAKELGDSRMHVCTGVPWVIAGGGDTFRLGRRVDMTGITHDAVLGALANAYGIGLSSFGSGSSAPTEVL